MDTHLADQQVQRICACLEILVKTSGRTRRSLEKTLGLGNSGLSKILRGSVRLQLSHVLLLTQALGVDPGQFFRWALPPQGRPDPLLSRAKDGDSEMAEALYQEEFDRKLCISLARLLGIAL